MAEVVVDEANSRKGGLHFSDSFRKEATAPDRLDELCFTHFKTTATIEERVAAAGSGGSVAEVSCASSTCSLSGSGNTSDGGSITEINAKLLKRTASRHGRSTQRWVSDPSSHGAIRLTTGCVPIVKGSKVLFVSASSKPSWIFPKGGWESDETMEESALREAYEEAGVIGVLGPRLSEVQYETRKARKRRLETEEVLKRMKREKTEEKAPADGSGINKEEKKEKKAGDGYSSAASVASAVASGGTSEIVIDTTAVEGKANLPTPNPAPVSDEAIAKMRGNVLNNSKRHLDETSSIQSDASSYSQVRMSLFPLYVTSIQKEWPEGSRLRRAVPIDEAIKILEGRPELQSALIEVKKRGLHLLNKETTSEESPPQI